MSKTSFTANEQANNSVQSIVNSTSNVLSSEDFVIVCPYQDGSLQEAILALYYLPPQFKLRVLIDAVSSTKFPFASHEAIRGRISLETALNTPVESSVFERANVVVHSEASPLSSHSSTQRVLISRSLPNNELPSTYTVAESSPEALASVFLRIAKTAA